MNRGRNIVMTVMVALLMLMPLPSKAYVFVFPAAIEGTVALFSSVEAAYVAIAGTGLSIAGRQTVKQGSKYAVKQSINVYVKPLLEKQLLKSLVNNKEMLKNIRSSKIIFNPSYVPIAGKQLLYYILLEHDGSKYYKIGITKHSLKMRYRRECHSAAIDPVLMLEMPMNSALVMETAIKTAFITERANNRKILAKDGGYSEVYGRDILEMDGFMLSAIKWIE